VDDPVDKEAEMRRFLGTILKALPAYIRLVVAFYVHAVPGLASSRYSGRRRRSEDEDGRHRQQRYLFVCVGDQARLAPGFLAVVDFDPASPEYGHVLATGPFPAPNASGNEPHHIGLSRDGSTVACGGLLSVLKGQDEVFFFDVSVPASPRFLASARPPLSSITDEFQALPQRRV
jgi:selenium-binding protein 1